MQQSFDDDDDILLYVKLCQNSDWLSRVRKHKKKCIGWYPAVCNSRFIYIYYLFWVDYNCPLFSHSHMTHHILRPYDFNWGYKYNNCCFIDFSDLSTALT